MVSGKNAFLLGAAYLDKVTHDFKIALRKHLHLKPTDDVFATATGTLKSLATTCTVHDVTKLIVSVPAIMSLYAVVFTACGASISDAPPRKEIPVDTSAKAPEPRKSKPMY